MAYMRAEIIECPLAVMCEGLGRYPVAQTVCREGAVCVTQYLVVGLKERAASPGYWLGPVDYRRYLYATLSP